MRRSRQSFPKSSPYITQQGYRSLEAELQGLWHNRKTVVAALSAAAAEGDRSENAEYIYRKKELRGLDRRIHYLQKRLPSLKVISETPQDQDKVFFGARVTLENLEGESFCYRIVGADEINLQKKCISVDSPLARALLRKSLNDEVVINNGDAIDRFLIVEISYCCTD